MRIDRDTFTDLAVHLKLASDALLVVGERLATISEGNPNAVVGFDVVNALLACNEEISYIERTLSALLAANAEEGLTRTVPPC